jgi:non-ribosomal peptide synthetase component F
MNQETQKTREPRPTGSLDRLAGWLARNGSRKNPSFVDRPWREHQSHRFIVTRFHAHFLTLGHYCAHYILALLFALECMDSLLDTCTTAPCSHNTTTNIIIMSEKKNHSTLIDAFLGNVEAMPDRRFMTQPMGGGGADCNVKYWTFAETLEETKKMAHYLSSLHLPPGSSIALCSKNCAWWIIADLAIQMAGHVTIPIYPTLTGDTVQYILEHSESKLLFIGKLDEHPWNEMKTGVSKDLPTVSFPLSPAAQGEHDGGGGSHQTWDEIIRSNPPPMDPIVTRKPEEMATIIYTSGSTGTFTSISCM